MRRAGKRLGPARTAMWLVAFASAACLLRFPPGAASLYPRCPVHDLFGVLCPGCGGTRAVAALLRGRLREAFAWNAMITLLAPFTTVFAAAESIERLRGLPPAMASRVPQEVWAAVLFAAFVFSVWRNLA